MVLLIARLQIAAIASVTAMLLITLTIRYIIKDKTAKASTSIMPDHIPEMIARAMLVFETCTRLLIETGTNVG